MTQQWKQRWLCQSFLKLLSAVLCWNYCFKFTPFVAGVNAFMYIQAKAIGLSKSFTFLHLKSSYFPKWEKKKGLNAARNHWFIGSIFFSEAGCLGTQTLLCCIMEECPIKHTFLLWKNYCTLNMPKTVNGESCMDSRLSFLEICQAIKLQMIFKSVTLSHLFPRRIHPLGHLQL